MTFVKIKMPATQRINPGGPVYFTAPEAELRVFSHADQDQTDTGHDEADI